MTSSVTGLPRFLQLMWGITQGSRRGPKPRLAVGDIARAAVAIADSSGLEAVSMKAIADRLDVTPMSLYRYIEAKEDVYELMFDEAYGTPPPGLATAGGDWRTAITDWTMAIVGRQLAHPWVTALPMTRPPAGPQSLRWTDAGIAAFDGTGLPDSQRLSTLLLISGFTRNHVRMSAEMGAFDPSRESTADHYATVLSQVIDENRYPNLSRSVASGYLEDGGVDFFDEELRFGLDLILDGVAARIAC